MRVKRLGAALVLASAINVPAMADAVTGLVDVAEAEKTTLTLYQDKALVRQIFDVMPEPDGKLTVLGMARDWRDDSLELDYVTGKTVVAPERLWWHRGGLNRDTLYRRLVGKSVELLGGGLNVPVQGVMLSYDAGMALVQGSNGRQYLVDWQDPQGIRVASRDAVFLQKDYQSQLMAEFTGSSLKDARLRLSYITPSLSYSSHYRLTLGQKNTARLELNALISNNTDTDYSMADIQLVSGDVGGPGYRGKQIMMDAAAPRSGEQYGNRVGEVLVSKLPEGTRLEGRSNQQVTLFRKDPLKLEKLYTLDVYGRSFAGRAPALERPRLTYRFKADVDLPAGQVRMYEEAPDGGLVISGDAWLAQTTSGDFAHLSMGEAMAVRVERHRVDSQQTENEMQSRWRATVFNDHDEAITLLLTDRDRTLMRLEDVQGGTLEDASIIRISIPAGGQKQVTYTASYSR